MRHINRRLSTSLCWICRCSWMAITSLHPSSMPHTLFSIKAGLDPAIFLNDLSLRYYLAQSPINLPPHHHYPQSVSPLFPTSSSRGTNRVIEKHQHQQKKTKKDLFFFISFLRPSIFRLSLVRRQSSRVCVRILFFSRLSSIVPTQQS